MSTGMDAPKCKDCAFVYKNGYGTLLCHAIAYKGYSIRNPLNQHPENINHDNNWCEDRRNIFNDYTCEDMRKEGWRCGPEGSTFVKSTIWEKFLKIIRWEKFSDGVGNWWDEHR